MAYINFKEETAKGKLQLARRKTNNNTIIEKLKEHKESIKIEYDSKYSFRKIEGRIINNSKTLKEDEFAEITGENIVCATFISCKFYNIKFRDCCFYGCVFEDCDFGGGGVIFENCSFIKAETEKTPSLNVKDNLSCYFKGCSIYAKFISSDISYLIIEDSLVHDTNFEMSDLTSLIIISSELKMIDIIDADLSGAKIIDTYIVDFEFNDKLRTKIDEKTFFDKIKLRKKDRDEYEGIYKIYESIADKFKENNLKNNFGEYYYQCRKVQRGSLKPFSKLLSYLDWFFMGYGERVINPLAASLTIIIIFSFIYIFIGIDIEGEILKMTVSSLFKSSWKDILRALNEGITISVGMFAGSGIVVGTPVQEAYLIAAMEEIIGFIMMGTIIATITRKFVR